VQPAAIPNGAGKDPDWKAILTELVTTLERYGDRLPLLVLSQMRGVEKVLDLQLGQLPPSEPMAPAAKRYHVKKRTKSNTTDFIVMRDGDKSRYRVFDTESEAQAVCEALNTSPVASIGGSSIGPQQAKVTAFPRSEAP